MTPERWKRVEEVFQAALDRDPRGRPAFLDAACAGDEDLKREVDSLVAAHETSRNLLEIPVLAPPAEPTSLRSAAAGIDGTAGGLVPGQLLAGRYRVRRLLAQGGMGEVYEVDDLELGVPVALKTIRPEVAAEPQALRRFKQEVLLARAITHPRVCRVFDLGIHRQDAREVAFLTMELLSGETLAARIRKRGRLGEIEALPLVRQMAEALEAAHQTGIVHRDFKSGNVMLVPQGDGERVVVMDFGLAHAAAEAAAVEGSRTAGTPAYMAPEQVRGERTGPAADLYALGVVVFEMVTGRLPFEGETALATARMRLEEEPPSPRGMVAELNARWEEAILRLLRQDPQERFARATDLVRWLEGGKVSEANERSRDTLPAESDAFVGRAAELEELEHRLDAGARLVTVLGPAGVGKTRLARRFGWSALARFPGGVWFCDLSEARSVDGIASAVAAALGVPLGREDPVVQLGHAIAGRGRALFVLDNFEQAVEHAPGTVGQWAERAPEAQFVITSRERLGLPGEDAWPLEPLEEGASVELFAARARAQQPGFSIDEGNRESVRTLVHQLEGLPLAIELAASRLRILSLPQILQRVEDRFQLLAGAKSGGRHATLQAAIDGSWELLSPWEKRAFAQCSVFEGGFTLEAAEEVLDLGPDAPAVMDVVQALVDKSLLRVWVPRVAASSEPRFSMYLTLQEYARQKLAEAEAIPERGNEPQAERHAEPRHGAFFARLGTQESLESLDRHGGVERREKLALELDNLVAACRRAIGRGDGGSATATYRGAWAVLDLRGPTRLGVEMGREVLAVEGLAPEARGHALLDAGRALWRDGRMDEARAHEESALAVACRVGDRRFEGIVLYSLGSLHYEQGRPVEAQGCYERALAIHREVGNRVFEGIVLGNLGSLQFQQGRLEEAWPHYQRALAIHREVGNRRYEGIVLLRLGGLHLHQGALEEARTQYEHALAIAREIGDRRFEGVVLGELGYLHREHGRREEAQVCLERALAIHREVGHRRFEALVVGNLGCLHLDQGRAEVGREHLELALAITREVADRHAEGRALDNLGSFHALHGRPEQAQACFEQALAIHRERGNLHGEGIVLTSIGEWLGREGRFDEARAALARSETLFRGMNDPLWLAKLLCSRSEVEHRAGDGSAACAALAEAESLGASIGAAPGSDLGRKLVDLRAALAQRA